MTGAGWLRLRQLGRLYRKEPKTSEKASTFVGLNKRCRWLNKEEEPQKIGELEDGSIDKWPLMEKITHGKVEYFTFHEEKKLPKPQS